MKFKMLALAVVLLSAITSCSGKDNKVSKNLYPEWILPDSAAYDILGKTLTNILFAPKYVKCYAIEWQDSVNGSQIEPHFMSGQLIKKLSKEEVAVIQYSLLSNSNNYVSDSIVVMSPYVPCLNFEFTGKKKEKANIVVSLSDFTWTIIFDDKKQFNFNYHSQDFERLCKYYLTQLSK